MKRQCDRCKEQIKIDRVHTHDIVRYKNKYYHDKCFIEMCEEKITNGSSRYRELWSNALKDINTYRKDAENEIDFNFTRDDFNEYLLAHYNVVSVPSDFWRVVSDIENGMYRKKKCNPASLSTFFDCWKWGQKNLDKIATKNEANNTGPKDGVERIRYDSAILVKKLPLYLKEQEKNANNAAKIQEAKEMVAKTNALNYDGLSKQVAMNSKTESNDILDLMDEIF